MGAGKEMWISEYEKLGEEWEMGAIEEGEFRFRMKRLGFDPHEIDDHMAAIRATGGE